MLHGNVVRPDRGVEHIVGLPFSGDSALLVTGSPVAAAAVAWARAEAGAAAAPVVALDGATLSIARSASWDVDPAADPRGIPVLINARIWPLELDDEA